MGNDQVSIGLLVACLFALICLSAFFSGTETALMSLNRYRLRHRARAGHRGARLAELLLIRPDRLIGLILLGNNLVNILAAFLMGVIVARAGVAASFGVIGLLFIQLIFAEVAPKTVAALHPEEVGLPAAYIYYPLLKLVYPVVWLVNSFTNALLRVFGVRADDGSPLQALTRDELKTVLTEGNVIAKRHQDMLLGILDLEDVTVDDIMVPRHEIAGIDLQDDWAEIEKVIDTPSHLRFPLYDGDLDNIVGMVHLRRVLHAGNRTTLNKDVLRSVAEEVYYVPEGTPLYRQLANFQQTRKRIGMVVDEYGDILGLLTLQDILEEIVGEFTGTASALPAEVEPKQDGSYVVDAGAAIRMLNRAMQWDLPTEGASTLNGLILEHLETIPENGTRFTVGEYTLEVVAIGKHAVKSVRMLPPGGPKSPTPSANAAA